MEKLSPFARSVLVNNLSLGNSLAFRRRKLGISFVNQKMKIFSEVADAYNGLEQRLGLLMRLTWLLLWTDPTKV